LTALEFQGLAAVPPEAEWFANIDNPEDWASLRIDIRENKVLFHTYLVTYFLDFPAGAHPPSLLSCDAIGLVEQRSRDSGSPRGVDKYY
jgi:hypothetical protein